MLKQIKKMLGLIPYTSEMDQFLSSFNQRHEQSASQKAEMAKTAQVANCRDDAGFSHSKKTQDAHSVIQFLG